MSEAYDKGMVISILKSLVNKVTTERLVEYMLDPATNYDEEQNDLMFEELRKRGFFMKEKNLELIK